MKQYLILALAAAAFIVVLYAPNNNNNLRETCNNFDGENACQNGQQTENPSTWTNRNFQTPPRGDKLWREPYQDYSILQGYTQIRYASGLKSAKLNVYTRVNPSSQGNLVYFFDGVEQTSSEFQVSAPKGVVDVKVKLVNGGKTIASLQLEPVDFHWNHPSVNQSPNYEGGQKGAIVELFGWLYEDIEAECEMLGKAGYMGVKIFPPQESILDYEHPEEGQLNPWYWLYQPVSYKLQSRAGTVEQLRKMINTCRSKNVRVYADAVVNHMSGNGNDMFPSHCSGGNFWPNKNSSAGSPWYTQGYAYANWTFSGSRPGMEFPQVPYGPLDFHCARSLTSWNDGFLLNYGWLVNLSDLNTESDYVRQRIADYITDLLSIGISGIRIDAAKHISPENLAHIFKRLSTNMGGSLPSDFTAYLEVILGGEKDLLMCNDGWYNYGKSFDAKMKEVGLSDSDIYKIKIWSSDYPKEHPACGYWIIPANRFAIQQDCHDDQNPGSSSRDMQDKGSVLIKERNVDRHRNFNKELFSRTDADWKIKLVLSSYSFWDNPNAQAPPDGHSDCSKCSGSFCSGCTKSVPYRKAHNPNVCGYTMSQNGQWIQGEYTRVHRDKAIILEMRKWMGLSTSVSNADLGLPDSC